METFVGESFYEVLEMDHSMSGFLKIRNPTCTCTDHSMGYVDVPGIVFNSLKDIDAMTCLYP
jgi:hypothetical protein